MIPRLFRRALFLLVILPLACGHADDGTAPSATSLPALSLLDDTPGLLLTWVDARGDYHTAQHPVEVPAEGRAAVRVVVLTKDEGAATQLVYVADLNQKKTDGSYVVNTMTRTEWEAIADARRAQRIAAVAPHATAAPSAAAADDFYRQNNGKAAVVMYGAPWCGYCKAAREHLKKKGVPYVYKDIEADDAAADEMSKKLARAGKRPSGVPVFDVAGRMFIGFDARELDAAIQTANKSGTALLRFLKIAHPVYL